MGFSTPATQDTRAAAGRCRRQGSTSGGKLATKMNEASLPEDVIRLAVDMRRGYAAASRTPRYLEAHDAARIQNHVKSEVMSLSARLASGQLDLDGAFMRFALSAWTRLPEKAARAAILRHS